MVVADPVRIGGSCRSAGCEAGGFAGGDLVAAEPPDAGGQRDLRRGDARADDEEEGLGLDVFRRGGCLEDFVDRSVEIEESHEKVVPELVRSGVGRPSRNAVIEVPVNIA